MIPLSPILYLESSDNKADAKVLSSPHQTFLLNSLKLANLTPVTTQIDDDLT